MSKFKNVKSILLTTVLTLGISLFASNNVFAATYTTLSGDSLYKVSKLFSTTTTNLINDNKLISSTIYPGQVLYVSCKTYTVQNGDSLYLIAKKYGIALYTLRIANNLWTDNVNIGKVLNIPVAPSVTPIKTIVYSASDVDLLSRLITAEAQDQPYTAKVAVGAVVINRVKSTTFANSISTVIYQTINGYYQFTPVLNGWINKPADADSIRAAKAALSGIDPTNGALFYFDDTVTNKWLLAKPVSITIDNLIFAF
ncbi:MAG: LysM peptidoglycan-binding domain-containing protein [Clostridiaceae bacterium]|nr:LysM peptidoglycan-binding domain-containing protein [Clostridiaceae bacterium]